MAEPKGDNLSDLQLILRLNLIESDIAVSLIGTQKTTVG